MNKKILIAASAIILVLVFAVVVAFNILSTNLKQIELPDISDIDLTEIEDGVYTGSYSSFPLSAVVKVVVMGHKITGFNLVEHYHGRGIAAEAILGEVVSTQSLDVEIVSGATYSSKVILNAIADALKQGL